MSEFAQNHEQHPVNQQVEHAAKYLQDRLKATGSFENLIVAIQHDYSGDLVAPSNEPSVGERIMGEDLSDTRVGAREMYEDGVGTGQLYQMLRIADSIANPDSTDPQHTHAFYAGELLGMTVVDFITENENDVAGSILGSLAHRRESKWKKLTNGFPTTEQNFLVRKEISREVRQSTYDFSISSDNQQPDLETLFNLLTETVPETNISYIAGGYWLILKEWLQPDSLYPDDTVQASERPSVALSDHTREAIVEAAKRALQVDSQAGQKQPSTEAHTALTYDEIMADFEMQFSDNEFDFDISEWNRESLNDMAHDIVARAVQIRIDAASRSLGDPASREVARLLSKRLQHELNRYIDVEYGLDEDDLLYAHGTFVGIANSKLPLADYDENGVLQNDNRQFAYQAMSPEDYRNLLANPDADIIPYEVRGSFDKIVITKAVSDIDSYTADIDDASNHDRLTYDSFVPAIRILNASIIDMRRNVPVEHINDMVIPLTHTHLELGRFVPPAHDDD